MTEWESLLSPTDELQSLYEDSWERLGELEAELEAARDAWNDAAREVLEIRDELVRETRYFLGKQSRDWHDSGAGVTLEQKADELEWLALEQIEFWGLAVGGMPDIPDSEDAPDNRGPAIRLVKEEAPT